MRVIKAATQHEMEACFGIRRKVFIEMQGVTEEEEMDGLDSQSIHFLLIAEGRGVGTARLRYVEGRAKIERVCILTESQSKGLGSVLMRAVMEEIAAAKQARVMFLSAQKTALEFYKKLGFEVVSDEYLDARIPHYDMQKSL